MYFYKIDIMYLTLKKCSIVCSMNLMLSLCCAQQSPVGIWQGFDGQQSGIIELDSMGYIAFYMGGDSIGGQKCIVQGQPANMQYTIQQHDSIYFIDVEARNSLSGLVIDRSKGVYGMQGTDSLLLTLNKNGYIRPERLWDKNLLILRRIEKIFCCTL